MLALTGNKGSGKDTFAQAFTKENFVNLKFGAPLKEMLRALYRYADVPEDIIERKMEGDLREVPCELLGGKTPRYAQQTLGTEWRNMIDPDLWVNITRPKAQALHDQGAKVICTDVRRISEQNMVREFGATLIRVHRPGNENRDNHVSELEMEGLEVDTTVYNVGSISDLHQQATTYLQELN